MMRTQRFIAVVLALLVVGVLGSTATSQRSGTTTTDEHAHLHIAHLSGSEILPPLDATGWEYQLVEVAANDGGFTPGVVHVKAGIPIILVFSNTSSNEHHFHISELEPQELSWFMVIENALDLYDVEVLFAVERAKDHICDSVTGICRLGINVHLHANPMSFDAIMFTASKPGEYVVDCPLHPELTALFVVE
jgi:plastocyanin